YPPGELDLVGCIVGDVARADLVDGRASRPGDRLLGLPSDGLHTNGYSLARHILLEEAGLGLDETIPGTATTVADALLARHRMYLPLLQGLLGRLPIHAMAHITGGGIPENLPRVIGEKHSAVVSRRAWTTPPLFRALAAIGRVGEDEMFSVFNMGIGYILIVPESAEADWIRALEERGTTPVRLGSLEEGPRTVRWDEKA
ncbi:MAG: AIR synthase-related protein, partial [Candidatus Eisenbacteria bacterium]|nr:AIR synthase-related protein [Candidatus Eisenbacteria bacterium]